MRVSWALVGFYVPMNFCQHFTPKGSKSDFKMFAFTDRDFFGAMNSEVGAVAYPDLKVHKVFLFWI